MESKINKNVEAIIYLIFLSNLYDLPCKEIQIVFFFPRNSCCKYVNV